MMDDFELAHALFGSSRGGDSPTSVGATTTQSGTALANSDGGRVMVSIDGLTVAGDGGSAVEAGCVPSVMAGDRVTITTVNGRPTVTGVVGWGDGVRDGLVAALTQSADAVRGIQEAKDAATAARSASEAAQAQANESVEVAALAQSAAGDARARADAAKDAATAARGAADAAQSTADGARGAAAKAQATAGDALSVAGGVASHVWADSSGQVHVSTQARPAGGDADHGRHLLLGALGMSLRVDAQRMVDVTGGASGRVDVYDAGGRRRMSVTPSGVVTWDADGTTATATLAADSTLGKASGKHIVLSGSSGISLMDGARVLSSFTASAAVVGQASGKHIAITSGGVQVLDGDAVAASFDKDSIDFGSADSKVTFNGRNSRISYDTGTQVMYITSRRGVVLQAEASGGDDGQGSSDNGLAVLREDDGGGMRIHAVAKVLDVSAASATNQRQMRKLYSVPLAYKTGSYSVRPGDENVGISWDATGRAWTWDFKNNKGLTSIWSFTGSPYQGSGFLVGDLVAAQSGGSFVYYECHYGTATCYFNWRVTVARGSSNYAELRAGTLPGGVRPGFNVVAPGSMSDNAENNVLLRVRPSGAVSMQLNGGGVPVGTHYVCGQVCWTYGW